MSTEATVLTVQDLLNELHALVAKNPKAGQYQIAEETYDDYSCSHLMFYSGCTRVDVTQRPKDEGFTQGVSDELTSKCVVLIN